MITAMPRPRPPFLHHEPTRHGKHYWYVRRGHGRRIRIKAQFGTPEFDAAYKAAIDGQGQLPQPKMPVEAANSLAWLIARYRETIAWMTLSPATRRQRENIFKHVIANSGTVRYAAITSADVAAGRDRRAATPAQARNFHDAMRGLFRWAIEAKLLRNNSSAGVKNPKRKKGPGFRKWTEEDMAAYERRWPIGTKERVWLDVIAYSGLRRGDAVRAGRQHIRTQILNGVKRRVLVMKLEKTGFTLAVTLPILPVLDRTLEAGPCGDLTFIAGATRNPLTKETFGNYFREACDAAGVPGSAHGLRKLAATRAANNGATDAELDALFGWGRGSGMSAHYTREAERERLSSEAMHKLANDERTSIPAPEHEVRELERKKQ